MSGRARRDTGTSPFDPNRSSPLSAYKAPSTLDRAGFRCPGDHMPSSREMIIGQSLLFSDQPKTGRIATYRAVLGPDLPGNAISVTFVGANGRNHSDVADDGVAATVIPWMRAAERSRGDLR